MVRVPDFPRSRETGASGVGSLLVLGMLVALGLAGFVLVSTIHLPPPPIREGAMRPLECPADVAEAAEADVPRTCRSLDVVNTGDVAGVAMCTLQGEGIGATAAFADNGLSVHTVDVPAHDTATLLVRVDGKVKRRDRVLADCTTFSGSTEGTTPE